MITMKIRGLFLAIMLVLIGTSSGCSMIPSPLDLLTPDKPSIELNANVGKNVEQDKSVIKIESGQTTKQEAETISNDTSYKAETVQQITEHIPPWILGLLILFAGWVIPDPSKCVIGVKSVLHDVIVKPITGIANFILMLFGREQFK
jgi:hypothetical protein